MRPKFAKLTGAEGEQRITRETAPLLCCALQRALLLRLHGKGSLTDTELGEALDLLRQKYGGERPV